MKKKFYFKPKVSLICLIIAALMCRASYWQYERHEEKKAYIAKMQERLVKEPTPLSELVDSVSTDEIPYRRALAQGKYDFSEEIVLRNRRLEKDPGVHVITPLKLPFTDRRLLVVRGFLPLSVAEQKDRKTFQKQSDSELLLLLKHSNPRGFLAPNDPPTGDGHPRVDAFLRVDIEHIQKQLPYEVFPFYAELMTDEAVKDIEKKIVRSVAGREEVIIPDASGGVVSTGALDPNKEYPVPVFDTVIPAGRHFGYIFEWIFLALLTLGIGVLIQLRPPAKQANSTGR